MANTPLHVVILAAGKGSRMRSKLPKVLHQVAGKSLLQHVVDSALELCPSEIHVVVGHGKEQVINAFESHPSKHKLNWVVQTEQLGTGHAVAQALPTIPNDAAVLMLTADVPLIAADTLANMTNAMEHHPLALLTAFVDNPFGLGRILRDDTQSVIGIIEEKDASESVRQINEINSGIICAQKSHLTSWLNRIDNNNAQQEYYLTDIVALAHQTGDSIATFQPQDNNEINGINSRSQLALVERIYQLQHAKRHMDAGVTLRDPARFDTRGEVKIGEDTIIDINVVIEGPTTIGRDVKIGPNCVIKASHIADGTTILENTVIENAEIGENGNIGPFARLRPGSKFANGVKIGNFVETKNAQLEEGVKINHLSYVGDSSVGSNTNIGAGVITCNYDGANKHKTTIGKDVFVGSDCQLIAPVTIADKATIGAGSTITADVDEGELAVSRSQLRKIKDWQRPTKK